MADLFDKLKSQVEKLEETHGLREPCPYCGDKIGRISTKNGQDRLYCRNCDAFQYNAPRTETGREPRTLQSIRGIAPSKRHRILERANGKCELCGSHEQLTIAHIKSIKDGFNHLTDAELNSDDNLYVLCAECNAGQGHKGPSPTLLAEILSRRSHR